ncbi:MAG TPA: SDR family oxidoreductase [Verrucomicrobiae bacterium]|nr:SDR family oxidoreductase [Verrucomicrobiae bacterium]
MNRFDLTSKTAFISGSYRGLGCAIAKGLAEYGARVVINGRNSEKVATTVATLKSQGLQAAGCAFDVTDEAAIAKHVAHIESEVGPIDILVNNAGINLRHPATDFNTPDYRTVMSANLDSVFFLCREVGRRMAQRKRGKVINIGSVSGLISRPQIAAYSASKGAVHMLTRALATEWAGSNIQVNAIAPGMMETEMTSPLQNDKDFLAWSLSRIPAGRWGKPEDLIGAAVFLASPASDYVTGHVLFVDGGWTANY